MTAARTRPRIAAVLAAVVLTVAGCSGSVSGATVTVSAGPSSGVPSGAPALPEAVTRVLQAVPASPDTKQAVVVIDTPVLTAIAARGSYPSTQDQAGADGRDRGENAYLDLSPVQVPCRSLDATSAPLRTGVSGASVTIDSRSDGRSGSVSLCVGVADEALLRKNFAGGDGQATTVDGLQGLLAQDTFIGIDTAAGATVIRDGSPQSGVVSRVVDGTAADGSLWQDPDVVTVLTQMPNAAIVVLGTEMLSVPRTLAPGAVAKALATVVARNDFGLPPIPEFGGYGWVAGDRSVGTSVFVTLYGSDQEAATATAILTGVWKELGTSKYTGAVTRQLGSTVVTTVAGTFCDEFTLQDVKLAEYPGFLDRT